MDLFVWTLNPLSIFIFLQKNNTIYFLLKDLISINNLFLYVYLDHLHELKRMKMLPVCNVSNRYLECLKSIKKFCNCNKNKKNEVTVIKCAAEQDMHNTSPTPGRIMFGNYLTQIVFHS